MPWRDYAKRQAAVKRWRERNPERMEMYKNRYRGARVRANRLKREYGITQQDYDEILRAQGGRCAICRQEPTRPYGLVVDHCHATNVVRALLCDKCNTGLGAFRDDPSLLAKAMWYLTAHRQVAAVG